jgi:hypothetical protein
MRCALVAAAVLLTANAAAAQVRDKRFLVRYDHGTISLPAWAPLELHISSERIRALHRGELVVEFPTQELTAVTHELRSPFDPARVTEQVMNDTVGSCSNLLDCPVLGAAGVTAAAGVGVATLFTPKEYVITMQWREQGRPQELAVKIAWYQKAFILGAFEKATGRTPMERTGDRRPSAAVPPSAPSGGRQSTVVVLAPSRQPQSNADEPKDLLMRFEIILDRAAQVGDAMLEPGFYLVIIQERSNNKAMVVFLDNSVHNAAQPRILAKVLADIAAPAGVENMQPVFREDSGKTWLAEIQLPQKTLKLGA